MSKVNAEQVKATSGGLRGTLPDELANSDSFLSEAGKLLIKFHGSYQQENRDARKAAGRGAEKEYSFMIRSKLPGGQLTPAQYLVHDQISSDYGDGTIRLTTRQGIQFHGVIKGELRDTIRTLNAALVTTFGACGDVVRNVMCCPAPTVDPERRAVQAFASTLSDALLPRTKAYHQIWVEGESIIDEEAEPLYGQTYLPRKFKVGIALPGDNCVDIYTHDVGLVAVFNADQTLAGFNLLVGGGMGMTHNDEDTFPRLGDVIGFITPDQALQTVQAVVTIHRDFGDRTNRKHARIKYVLHEWGVARFREELQNRLPFPVQDARPMPAFTIQDHLGWNDQGDGKLFLGLPIENGRIADRDSARTRSGLRAIIDRFQTPLRLTAQQNILLTDIDPADRPTIDGLLAEYGIVTVEQISGVRRTGIACPALPTCPLAIAEAERALPGILDKLEVVMTEVGLANEPIIVRMTGCPNGCTRPYMAEIGFVGRSLNKYTVYLGGNPSGTRLAEPFLDLIGMNDLTETLRPVLAHYHNLRDPGEALGDFVWRVGFDSLRALVRTEKAPEASNGD